MTGFTISLRKIKSLRLLLCTSLYSCFFPVSQVLPPYQNYLLSLLDFSQVFPSHFVSQALRALRAVNQALRSGLSSSREALPGRGLSKTTFSFLAWGYSVFCLHISLVLSTYSFTYKLQLQHNLLPGLCMVRERNSSGIDEEHVAFYLL